MLTEQIETIERTAYEGLLTPSHSLMLGWAAAALAAWLLWRERRALGPWTGVFWGMRVAAIGLALWMLAGPTHQEIQRVTSPQSIAIFIDDTGSMGVADPPSPADDLRWRLAAGEAGNAGERLLVLCDRAGVQAAEAAGAAERLRDAIADHRSPRDLKPLVDRVVETIQSTRRLLVGATRAAAEGDELLAGRIDRVVTLLDDSATPLLEEIAEQLQAADADQLDLLAASSETLSGVLSEVERRRGSLALDAAQRSAERDTTPGGETRSERVAAVMKKLESGVLDRLEETCQVHRLRYSEIAATAAVGAAASRAAVRPVSSEEPSSGGGPGDRPAAGAVTDVAAILEQVERLRSAEPLRMALLLTDGRHNAPSPLAPRDVAARLRSTPVHVAPIGATAPVRDILIHRVEAPARVVRKDTATIEVLLTALDCAGEEVDVVLTRDGDEVDRQRMVITRDWQDGRVLFRIDTGAEGGDELGRREYEIEVDAVADESSLTNNLAVATIDVVRNKVRVLLADRGPRWEYRYLQQLFRRDKHVEFDELLLLPEPRATGPLEATGRLPVDADGWAEYDVVILGDLGPKTLGADQQASLDEYVRRRGGALVLIAGRENMPHRHLGAPLMELLPVTANNAVTPREGFGVSLTDEARLASCVALRESFAESRRAWQSAFTRLPIYGLSAYCRPKPNTSVLVEAAPTTGRIGGEGPLAFFSWHPLGAGKVAYLAAPQSYVLRFRRGDRDHHAFWGQTLRWITADQGPGRSPVRIDTDRVQYATGQPIEATVWLRDKEGRPLSDAEVRVEARSFDRVVAETELRAEGDVPGRYVGAFERLPTGAFELVPVGDAAASLLAGADPPRKLINVESTGDLEMLDTQCDRPLLEQIAELTGGRLTPPTAIAELLTAASLDPAVSESPPRRTPLWNRWSYFAVIAGCLATEWVVRKAKGLT